MSEEKWLINPGQTKTIDLDGIRAVKIGLIGGQVDVIGHDEPTTRVEITYVEGKDLKVTLTGDKLEIDHPQLRWDNFIEVFKSWNGKAKAHVSVLVPRDVALKLGTVSADALVSGLITDAELSTVSGDLTADTLVGDLRLNAVSGELAVRAHLGALKANTVSGDVTASGTLSRVSVDGVSGNVFLDVAGIPDTIRSNTVSGDLTLRIDADVPARYKVNTVSGVLQVQNSIFRGASARNFDYQDGPLDGHWIEVTANSVSGNLSVVRRAPAQASDDAHRTGQPSA
ncbi:DUF4097 family beta strand repeat-containing protein [Gryllotalpicola ginsengisoli]|uniref:DUF4097 family beta strand repeat-containing protein n=1 Tax=Gryllotalpicola ginsengisoli TaxID=444608 RepID=UPI0003B66068|nr:DUF4097 family beta strand repeat-containing protein [Gryllotalpicola ginsengisoli]